jgi:outer membrane protein
MRFCPNRRSGNLFAAILASASCLLAQTPGTAPAGTNPAETNVAAPDYSRAAPVFRHFWEPYKSRPVPNLRLSDSDTLEIHDGKMQLSLEQVIDEVVANNLTVASARYFPSMAQTDLLRARSGASPRGVDAAVIPSVVFSGAEGGSILGTAGGGGGGASNAGGITGAASAVSIRPAGVFDPSISVAFSRDHTASPLNTEVVSGLPSVTTGTTAYSISYVQAFPSGTSFTASYSYQRQLSDQLHLLYNPAFTPGYTVSVAQQMLNGFGFAVNRALIKVAQNELGIERESFRSQTVTVLVAAQNAYWDLIAAQESVRAAQLEVEAADQLVENNRKSFEAGIMSRIDIVTAESQAASSRRDLLVAQTNEQNAEITIKTYLTRNVDQQIATAAIEATDPFPDPETSALPALQDALDIAKKNRPEVSIAEGNIKSEHDVLPFIQNSLLPSVNVFGLLSNVALGNVYGTPFVEAFEFKYPQYAFGVTISFTLRNRQAQADNIRSRLELRQEQDTLVRTKSQVEVDVQNGLVASTQAKSQVQAAHEAMLLAQEQLDAEQKRLAAGISTAYNVILAQRDLLTARLAEVQARDAYAKARVTLDQAMGMTFDKFQLTTERALNGR